MNKVFSYKRQHQEKELESIIRNDARPQLVYVRGRRRVGKSWILKKVSEESKENNKYSTYFSGTKDSSAEEIKIQFINKISQSFDTNQLKEINLTYLDWTRIFAEIIKILKTRKRKHTLIFDEIQWIAKTGSGFVGALKEAWIDIEKHNLAHIIVCGSSNKFFHDHVGGEEKLLRGLQTRSAIVVEPIPLYDVKKYVFPKWTQQEVALLYMLIGGVPYYLQQIDASLGFINSINQAIFTSTTIFLDEVDEILGLEFNKLGLVNIKKILSVLADYGGSQAKVRKLFKISPSTISPLFEKLQNYKLIEIFNDFRYKDKLLIQGKENRFFINDFYLNTFFSVLEGLSTDIKKNANNRNNIFAHRVLKNNKYYIEGFSGKAFEQLLRYCIRAYNVDSPLYKALLLKDYNFELYSIEDKATQIDLVVAGKTDRIARIVECKWADKFDMKWLSQVSDKKIELPEGYTRVNVIFHSCLLDKRSKVRKAAQEKEVVLLELGQLFLTDYS